MSGDDNSTFLSDQLPAGAKQAARPRRTLLVVARDELPDCIVHAVERQFGWIRVEQFGSVAAACVALRSPALLILIDCMFVRELAAMASELARLHPGVALALLQNDKGDMIPVHEILDIPNMHGVLPMDLKLDLWLSVLQLMLQGGHYLPPPMIQAMNRGRRHSDPGNAARRIAPHVDVRRGGLAALTEREAQILELVSRGLQNKLIASDLDLSENTIKIHLHNIITKLGVHNRTEAASLFRAGATPPAAIRRTADLQRPLP